MFRGLRSERGSLLAERGWEKEKEKERERETDRQKIPEVKQDEL